VAKSEALEEPANSAVIVVASNAPPDARVEARSTLPLVSNSPPDREQSNSPTAKLIPPDATNKAVSSAQPASPSVPVAPVNDSPPALVWWLGGALAIIIALLAVVIILIRRQTTAIPKALLTEGDRGVGSLAVVRSNDPWRERALQAEAIAAQQAQILKEKVGPELVRFAKETLVQGLYTQRNALLDTQAKAQQTLVELEARLSELHLPVQERIQAYERRISELEKQLESRNDETRELTRATLLLVQKKLEQERQGTRFN
jgi:hypothetical protein